MLKKQVAIVEYIEEEMSFSEFRRYVVEARWFYNEKKFDWQEEKGPEVGLYRHSLNGNGIICMFAEVPADIFPGEPKRSCDWDDYVKEHLEYAYNYLSEKDTVIT